MTFLEKAIETNELYSQLSNIHLSLSITVIHDISYAHQQESLATYACEYLLM